MPDQVSAVPEGHNNISPYLIVDGASAAIEFYQAAFGATELMRLEVPGGRLVHAELKIGDSVVMLSDEYPEMDAKSPGTFGGSPVMMHLYIEDVDAVVARAEAAGAKVVRPVQDQFYGDRSGSIVDPFGHSWNISTHIEDLTPEEIEERMAGLGGG